jgi:hypothetical protein
MIEIRILRRNVTMDHIGMIPHWLDEKNPQSAAKQLNDCYGHGGGWNPFSGFKLRDDNSLKYPGDPPLWPLAEMNMRDELIMIYEHSWVVIVQPDRSFEACRMD